jgi:tetratricopeptide (TPR) repeat protein
MNAEGHYNGACEVTEPEARAELKRLLSDQRFHGTERARSILTYLAQRHFEGRPDGVKAYSIALDVLGRTSDFDPSGDPIVRIEVSRLRSSLSQYYQAFGNETSVSIHLPKGRYVTAFTRCVVIDSRAEEEKEEPDAAWGETPEAALDRNPPLVEARRAKAISWRLPAALALIVSTGLSAGAVWYVRAPAYSDKPTVAVVISAADQKLQGEAGMTRDMLVAALTHFRTLTVASNTHEQRRLSNVLRPAIVNSYEIELKYYGDGDDRSVWWQIVDAGSGDLVKSGLDQVDAAGKTSTAVRNELVTILSRRFATSRGAINNIETHDSAAGALGNACVLRAEYQLDTGGLADVANARGCLEQTVAAEPGNSDATAALSRVLLAQSAGAPSGETMVRSLDLANRAVSLSPLSDRAEIALMMAQFHSGRIEAAISAGNRALSLNPNNPDVSAKFAMVLFSAGYWEAGVSMAEDAGKFVDAVPRDAELVLALDAYRRGDWPKASLIAEQVNCSDFVVRILRAAALGQLGSDQAAQRLADVRSRDPDFEQTFRDRIASQRYRPALSASLEDGLKKAGAQFKPESVASAF